MLIRIPTNMWGSLKSYASAAASYAAPLLKEDEDALFYANKLKTTRYFVEVIIPQFDALLVGGKKQNYDALDIVF